MGEREYIQTCPDCGATFDVSRHMRNLIEKLILKLKKLIKNIEDD